MEEVARTGVAGLDEIMGGGFPREHLYLVEGDPGVGKTTLGLQFLLAGRDDGERCLYVTLSETAKDIHMVARSHGWDLAGIELFELSALEQQMRIDAETTMFQPSEVQLNAVTQTLLTRIDEVKPSRVVFDSLSELRLLAQSALRYRREVLSFKQYLAERRCTALLLDDRTSEASDLQVQSIAHGVIALEKRPPTIGSDRCRLRVTKLRGVRYRTGYHDYNIATGGLEVYPRLVAAESRAERSAELLASGNPGLDRLAGGGLQRGISTLVTGPAGAGKTSVTLLYACSAAARGERTVIYQFDEQQVTLLARADALGLNLSRYVADGLVICRQIDPAEMGPGEFVASAQAYIEHHDVRVVVIDSINGLLQSMPEDRYLYMQLHELLAYLSHRGVSSFMVLAQSGMAGAAMQSPAELTYIADAVLLLRFFEFAGRFRKAISVVKKRSGRHEDTIRELVLDERGITVGEPLAGFHGVLTGVPTFVGSRDELS